MERVKQWLGSRATWRELGLLVGLVFGVTLALFSLGITDGYLRLDDGGYTRGCPFVKDGFSWANLKAALTTLTHGGIWMPLTSLTYMLDISLWGSAWSVHHAVNVVLHAVNAVLVLLFLRLLVFRFGVPQTLWAEVACSLGALLWALHPLRAEAVVWIASRKEELWALCVLLASLGWVRFLERGGMGRYCGVWLLFVLACLAKPSAVCFPLLAWWLQVALTRKFFSRSWVYVPFLLVSVVVGLIAVFSQTHPKGLEEIDVFETTFTWRLLNALVSLGMYLWHSVMPLALHLDYRAQVGKWPLDGEWGLGVLAGAIFVVGLLFLVTRHRHVFRRALVLALGWAFLSLLPVLGLIGFTGDKAYADRYTYLPSVAVSFLLVLCVARFIRLGSRPVCRGVVLVGFALCPMVLALWACPIIHAYENDYAAYTRVLRFDPQHWRALRTIGCEYCARFNRMDEGVDMLRRSLRLKPSQQTASSLAYVLSLRGATGDFEEVKRLCWPVARQPRLDQEGMMLEALATVSMREGDYSQASRFYEAALVAPKRAHANLHVLLNYGLCLANIGLQEDAIVVLRKLEGVSDEALRVRVAETLRRIESGEKGPWVWR